MSFNSFPSPTLFKRLTPANAAVFLDFDGVLVELAQGPNEITVPKQLVGLLKALKESTQGATAIITGRSLDDLQCHLSNPLDWIAGSHGSERVLDGHPAAPHALAGSQDVMAMQSEAMKLKDVSLGVEVELKPAGAVIHYRKAPDHADRLGRAAMEIAKARTAFECHRAKMAFELRPADLGKDQVVADWMEMAPFRGRVPVYFGDDVTDEPALDYVQKCGGIAIKVGEGDSVASIRVDGPSDVLHVLRTWMQASRDG